MDEEAAALDLQVRAAVYDGTVASGLPPAIAALQEGLGLPREQVTGALRRLAAGRALVLQPESGEVLMAGPFSAVATPFAVRAGGRLYYGNCVWDALGVAAMLGGDARVDCSCGCCGEAMRLEVAAGRLAPVDGVVHFAVPARRWWQDIVFT